jgi:hypothetical protein
MVRPGSCIHATSPTWAAERVPLGDVHPCWLICLNRNTRKRPAWGVLESLLPSNLLLDTAAHARCPMSPSRLTPRDCSSESRRVGANAAAWKLESGWSTVESAATDQGSFTAFTSRGYATPPSSSASNPTPPVYLLPFDNRVPTALPYLSSERPVVPNSTDAPSLSADAVVGVAIAILFAVASIAVLVFYYRSRTCKTSQHRRSSFWTSSETVTSELGDGRLLEKRQSLRQTWGPFKELRKLYLA